MWWVRGIAASSDADERRLSAIDKISFLPVQFHSQCRWKGPPVNKKDFYLCRQTVSDIKILTAYEV